MSTPTSPTRISRIAALWLAAAAWIPTAWIPSALAQDAPLDSVKINLPADSPLGLISANMGESRSAARGGAMVLDLRMSLTLRNNGFRNVRGVTLLITAQEMTPGGRASVSVPSLDVPPGAAFPVRVDVRLMRPLGAGAEPLVQVGLDGVLFQDLSFYGPNRLESRRSLTAWEMEAQRDRSYFSSVLRMYGPEGLRRAAIESLSRQAERPRLDVQVVRGRTVTSAAILPERRAQFAFLKFPDAPVEPVEGWAQVAGNEARRPRIDVRNRSGREVRYVEIGWLVRGRDGKEFLAASVPASGPELSLPAGKTASILQESSLSFSRNAGQKVEIGGMTGFVSQVEFTDGKVWVPNRASLENAHLLGMLAPSPEEQRLTDLYRKKGLTALVEELKKY